MTKEYERLIYAFPISLFIVNLIKWLLFPKCNFGKSMKKTFTTIIKAFIFLLHLLYSYFFFIFGNIHPHIQMELFWSTFISLCFYILYCIFIYYIIKFLEYCSVKCKSQILSEIIELVKK